METSSYFCWPRILFLIAAVLPLDTVAAADSASPPNHVLFMGADISVLHAKKLYLVKDVTGSALSIRVDGDEVLVPTRRGPINLHVDADLKLSSSSVQLDELKAGPGYSYANDPMRQLEETNRTNLMMADQQDLAIAGVPRAEANLAAVIENASHYTDKARADREITAATFGVLASNQTLNSTNIAVGSESSHLGSGANRMALKEGNFDAMEVSFKASSSVELDRPYMVVLFRFHDPAAKPEVNGLVIHAQALDPIDAQPRYVRVLKGGLPQGFKFVDCAVHIYNRGKEVATNRSDMRTELTRAETQKYLVVTHRGAHKGATLPAAAVPGTLPHALREAMNLDQLTRYVYAKVASDGSMLGGFADADCTVPLKDAGAAAALGEIFFAPALEAGKPVDGVARVRFSDI
ncbi:MAG TPA: hypothetical protein VGM64_09840 [Lacunisphaera sp.]|jgi:hypothetical protein